MPTTSLGIVTPAGTDRVAVAIDLQTMANGTNQAILDQVAAVAGAPVYPAGADLNDKITDGANTVLGSDAHANRPFGWNQTAKMETTYITSTAGLQTWAEVGGQSRTASRYRGSIGWQPWVRTDNGASVGFGTLTSGVADQTLPVGMYAIPDPSVVTGLPSAAIVPGALEVAPQLLTFSTSQLPGETWEKRFVGGLWQQWMRVRRQVSQPWALTRPQAATTETQVSRSVRLPFTIPAPVRQWRVVIRNANYRTNTVYTGGTTLSSVYVGPGARDSSDTITSSFGAATTDFPSGQKALVANATVSDLGAGWTSGWQQNPLRTGRDYLLSYGYTMDASPTVHLGMGGGWWTNGNPGNAGLTNDATAAAIIRAPFDVRLELILDDDTPVDIIIGDSINAGSNTTLPVHDAPARQGLTGSRRVPVLHAFGGAALGEWVGVNWGDASTIKWQDVTAYGHADRVLIALGSNDINNGTDLTTLQANFAALVALVRARVSTNIIACTVTPRTAWTGTANETLRQAFNAWLRSLPDGIVGCLETAAAVEDSNGTAPRSELVVGDGIHFTTAGSGMLGQAIAYGGGSSRSSSGAAVTPDSIGAETPAGAQAKVDAARWLQPTALTSTDVVDNLASGLYKVTSGTLATTLGLPTAQSGSLWIHRLDDAGTMIRRVWRPTPNTDVWNQQKHGAVQSAWESTQGREWGKGRLTPTAGAPVDLNTFTTPGVFEVPSPTSAQYVLNTPPGSVGPFTIENLYTAAATSWTQRLTLTGARNTTATGYKNTTFTRALREFATMTWGSWQRVVTESVSPVSSVALALTDTAVNIIPQSVGTDGYLYGYTSSRVYPVRSGDGLATAVEQGPSFVTIAGAGSGISYVTRTSAGYLVIYQTNATTYSVWFSTSFSGTYTKVLDMNSWHFTSWAKPRLIAGTTWMLLGEYQNTTFPSYSMKRWLSTDGGQTWTLIRQTQVSDSTVNCHNHTALIRSDGRIYVSEGDGPNNWFGYSDDKGASWIAIPTDPAIQIDAPYYPQPTVLIDFGDRIAMSPDRGSYQPGVWSMDPASHKQRITWELAEGGPYNDASKQYGRSVYAQAGATGQEAYVMFPDAGAGTNVSYIAATPDGGKRWGVVATIPSTGGTLNAGVIGPDRNGYLFVRGAAIPTYGSNVIRAKAIDWSRTQVV